MQTASTVAHLRLRPLMNHAAGRLAIWATSGSAPRKPISAVPAPR